MKDHTLVKLFLSLVIIFSRAGFGNESSVRTQEESEIQNAEREEIKKVYLNKTKRVVN